MPDLDLSALQERLDAIQYAESRGERDPYKAIGDKGMKYPAYGAYQMREPAFQDVRRLRPKTLANYPNVDSADDIIGNKDLQRALTAAYLNILMNDYKLGNLDSATAAYNWGVGNVRKHGITGKGKAYMDTIQSYHKKPKLLRQLGL